LGLTTGAPPVAGPKLLRMASAEHSDRKAKHNWWAAFASELRMDDRAAAVGYS
jgi:hypothetical protein